MRPLLLVVEDDTATRTLLTVVLTRAGFEVDSVANASDALLLLSVVPYAAMTLDLYLRGTSGHEVLAALATKPDVLHRTVVVSAAPAAEVADLRRRCGVAVVRKPFDLRDLVEITKSIAAAPEPLGVEAEFCRRSVALGAKAGIVLKPTAGGDAFTPAISYGYPRGATGAVFPLDLHAPYPICNSFRSGEKNWLPSISETRPVLSDIWRAAEAQAIVTLPLGSSDRRIGAVGWVFREPRTFGEPDRRGFAAVAGFLSERL